MSVSTGSKCADIRIRKWVEPLEQWFTSKMRYSRQDLDSLLPGRVFSLFWCFSTLYNLPDVDMSIKDPLNAKESFSDPLPEMWFLGRKVVDQLPFAFASSASAVFFGPSDHPSEINGTISQMFQETSVRFLGVGGPETPYANSATWILRDSPSLTNTSLGIDHVRSLVLL